MRGAHRVLVRLRLFPHRTLLDRRGLSGRALAPSLAHPVRHDRLPGGVALFYAAAARLPCCCGDRVRGGCSRSPSPSGSPNTPAAMCSPGCPGISSVMGLLATLPLMQAAAIFGVYALSLVAVLLFASPFAIWAPQGSRLARPKATALLSSASLLRLRSARHGERRGFSAPIWRAPACGFASCRPMSIRPINGGRRTARDLQHLSRSHQRRREDSPASRSWSGRRRRCRFPRQIPRCAACHRRRAAGGTRSLVGSGRIVDELDAPDRLVASASITACS